MEFQHPNPIVTQLLCEDVYLVKSDPFIGVYPKVWVVLGENDEYVHIIQLWTNVEEMYESDDFDANDYMPITLHDACSLLRLLKETTGGSTSLLFMPEQRLCVV